MYGLISKVVSVPNRREDLIAILQASTSSLPGCFSYVIAKDMADENSIWVTEIWDTAANHQASLSLPAVKDAIDKAKPMIGSFSRIAVTSPVAGFEPPK
jgi:quinol monooxygenase YgiN